MVRAGDSVVTNPEFPGIDFDVAPAQRGDISQIVVILMQNQVLHSCTRRLV